MKPSFIRTWGWPLIIGLLTLIGLVAALVADGFWDLLSAAALGIPVVVSVWHGAGWGRRREPSRRDPA
ncbi:hypothetical protein [Noviherbaspirillum malthae]|jgi:hypothetical protein|uniref:hypothetical protein n=1 Tax=Noviherbaspirillum malthae TaxID=1260987 RepID=UPI00188E09E2|nr:hypothetical protein [Noviherbaspirillum malthae]